MTIYHRLYNFSNNFNFFYNLIKKKSFPQSVVIRGRSGIGKKTFVCHLLACLFNFKDFKKSNNYLDVIENNKIFLNDIYNNYKENIKFVKINDNSKFIEIDQIREIISFCNLRSLNNEIRFIILCDANKLNINASNSILKLLELPPDNTYFILLSDNQGDLLETISSRCVTFNFNFSKKILNQNLSLLLNDFNLNFYQNLDFKFFHEAPGIIIDKLNCLKNNSIVEKKISEIILFFVKDFKTSKKIASFENAIFFSKYNFYNLLRKDFRGNYLKYKNFFYTLKNSKIYNSDYDYILKVINRA